jgi:hypothetical protein
MGFSGWKSVGFCPLRRIFWLLIYMKKQRINSDSDFVRRVGEPGSQIIIRLFQWFSVNAKFRGMKPSSRKSLIKQEKMQYKRNNLLSP